MKQKKKTGNYPCQHRYDHDVYLVRVGRRYKYSVDSKQFQSKPSKVLCNPNGNDNNIMYYSIIYIVNYLYNIL